MGVMQRMETCLNTLFLVSASLPEDGTESCLSEDECEVDGRGDGDTVTPKESYQTQQPESINTEIQSEETTRNEQSSTKLRVQTKDERLKTKNDQTLENTALTVNKQNIASDTSKQSSAKSENKQITDRPEIQIPTVENITLDHAQKMDCRQNEHTSEPHFQKQQEVQTNLETVCKPKYSSQSLSQVIEDSQSDVSSIISTHIPVPPLTLESGQTLDVLVTEVINPSMFWVQPVGPLLEDLMNEIYVYYSKRSPDANKISEPEIGMICCACYTKDSSWYRARVTAVHKLLWAGIRETGLTASTEVPVNIEVDVLYIDYGNRERLPLARLKILHEKFAKLPCQAFCCSLAEVAPPHNCDEWTPQQIYHFSELVFNRLLQAVISTESTFPLLFLDIYFPKKPLSQVRHPVVADIMQNVGDDLILRNLARKVKNEVIIRKLTPMLMTEISTPEMKIAKPSTVIGSQTPTLRKTSAKTKTGEQISTNVAEAVYNDTSAAHNSYIEDHQVLSDTNKVKTEAVTDSFINQGDTKGDITHNDINVTVNGESNDTCQLVPNNDNSLNAITCGFEKENKNGDEESATFPRYGADDWQSEIADDTFDECLNQAILASSPVFKSSKQPSRSLSDYKTEGMPIDMLETIILCADGEALKAGIVPEGANEKSPSLYRRSKHVKQLDVSSVRASDKTNVNQSKMSSKPRTPQQKLKDMGFPSRVPNDFQGKEEFQTWFHGAHDENTREVITSQNARRTKHSTEKSEKQSEKKYCIDRHLQQLLNTNFEKDLLKNEEHESKDDAYESNTEDSLDRNLDAFKDVHCLKEQTLLIPADNYLHVMMAHIDSPDLFYVHIICEESAKVDQLMTELNEHYSRFDECSVLSKFFEGFVPQVHDICCAKFSGDQNYYRAQIIDVKCIQETQKPRRKNFGKDLRRPTKVKVFYIDFGNSEWLSPSNIFPLVRKFLELPPLAYCCLLLDVYPLEDDKDWSKESVAQFEKLTGYDKAFLCYVAKTSPKQSPIGSDQLQCTLIDTSSEMDVWINRELVASGYARSKSSQMYSTDEKGGSDNALEVTSLTVQSDLNQWDPMQEDYLSIRNSYMVDVDDPGVALVGYKAKDERRICKFFASGAGCFRGDYCHLEHVIPRKGAITTDVDRVFSAEDVEHSIVCPHVGSWVAVNISAICSPDHFYAVFPFGTQPLEEYKNEMTADEGYGGSVTSPESLDQLMKHINEHYSSMAFRNVDLTEFALGEIIVAKFSEDERWYRAKIVNTDTSDQRVQVFYVDFGNLEWIDERQTRRIEPQFMQLPFQAIECFLDGVVPVKGNRWNRDAKICMQDVTDQKILFAHVLSKLSKKTLKVELFDTNGPKDININSELVKNGYGRRLLKARQPRQPKRLKHNQVTYLPG